MDTSENCEQPRDWANGRTGHLVRATASIREDGPFSCISCGDPLILRKGDVRCHHFAHRPNSICSGESYQHKLGKILLCLNLHLFKFRCTCPFETVLKFSASCSAQQEVVFENRRVDVMVFSEQGTSVAALEVHHTHAVTIDKRIELRSTR